MMALVESILYQWKLQSWIANKIKIMALDKVTKGNYTVFKLAFKNQVIQLNQCSQLT